MNRDDLDRFEKIVGQISSVYDEISILSKKSPADAVNKFKLRFVNELLSDSNNLLGDQHRRFADFKAFDVDDMPQNSDVVFILGQYLECFEKLRVDNVVLQHGTWYWSIEDEQAPDGRNLVRTSKPKRLRE